MKAYLETITGEPIDVEKVLWAHPFGYGDSWGVKVILGSEVFGEGVEKWLRGSWEGLAHAETFIWNIWGKRCGV